MKGEGGHLTSKGMFLSFLILHTKKFRIKNPTIFSSAQRKHLFLGKKIFLKAERFKKKRHFLKNEH